MVSRFVLSTLAASFVFSAAAAAQSFNIDFSHPLAGPPPARYAGAGAAGQWLSLRAEHGSTTVDLVDVNGVVTDVTLWQFGGTALVQGGGPGLAGADALLMRDALVTYTSSLETCLFFNNLDPGTYEVICYAWMPGQPDVLSFTNCDEEAGNPHVIVGGPWPGQHEPGVTYSRHVAEVTTGLLRVHSGIVPGADPALGAAMNGVQIRRLVDVPGDLDGDFVVGPSDLATLLAAWGPCPGCAADLDGDGEVGASDLAALLANWS
ncbi:MAG: hypothetical protein KDA25_09290 [Phycisphaerales bacterium]|nr:hypothetical protein [Phycisphaerales bacterium]